MKIGRKNLFENKDKRPLNKNYGLNTILNKFSKAKVSFIRYLDDKYHVYRMILSMQSKDLN